MSKVLKRFMLFTAALTAGLGLAAGPAAASDYFAGPFQSGIGVDHLVAPTSQSYAGPFGTDVEADDYFGTAVEIDSDAKAGPFRCPDKGTDRDCLGTDGEAECIGDGRANNSADFNYGIEADVLSDARKPGKGNSLCASDYYLSGTDADADVEIDSDYAVIDSDS